MRSGQVSATLSRSQRRRRSLGASLRRVQEGLCATYNLFLQDFKPVLNGGVAPTGAAGLFLLIGGKACQRD